MTPEKSRVLIVAIMALVLFAVVGVATSFAEVSMTEERILPNVPAPGSYPLVAFGGQHLPVGTQVWINADSKSPCASEKYPSVEDECFREYNKGVIKRVIARNNGFHDSVRQYYYIVKLNGQNGAALNHVRDTHLDNAFMTYNLPEKWVRYSRYILRNTGLCYPTRTFELPRTGYEQPVAADPGCAELGLTDEECEELTASIQQLDRSFEELRVTLRMLGYVILAGLIVITVVFLAHVIRHWND